jgi:6-phosphogluconolactonase
MKTELGTIKIMDTASILSEIKKELCSLASSSSKNKTVGLTGGSTPKAFYKFISEEGTSPESWENLIWATSDERFVPIEDDESNFGNAERGMLNPIGIADTKKFPWNTTLSPEQSAQEFNTRWNQAFGEETCFDLCLLGMGDDCHTASLFPGSPIIGSDDKRNFASVEVPGKGMRLTITESGFSKCKKIVITVTGQNKQEALKQVFKEDISFINKPVQLLKNYSEKVLWLIDKEAAGDLFI